MMKNKPVYSHAEQRKLIHAQKNLKKHFKTVKLPAMLQVQAC